MPKPLTWSYSVLTGFEDCPFRHYSIKVAKTVVEGQSEQMLWGNQVHKALELNLTINQPLPEGMTQWQSLVDSVKARATGGILEAEQKMALNRGHVPVTYFAQDVWVRGITDFTVVKRDKAFIGDWKTGKPTPASAQLKLTAAMTMHHKPWIKEIITAFVWLKTGGITAESYTRDDIPEIWDHFNSRVSRLEDAVVTNRWVKRPSGLCREYCPVHTCEHNGKYRG